MHERSRRKSGSRHDVRGEHRSACRNAIGKKVIQAPYGKYGENQRRNEAAPKAQQHDNDHICETSVVKVERDPEANQSHECESNDAE
jgi:hypothetical protein